MTGMQVKHMVLHTFSFCLLLRVVFSRLSLSEEDEGERQRVLLCFAARGDGDPALLALGWTRRCCDVTAGTKRDSCTGLRFPDAWKTQKAYSMFSKKGQVGDIKIDHVDKDSLCAQCSDATSGGFKADVVHPCHSFSRRFFPRPAGSYAANYSSPTFPSPLAL